MIETLAATGPRADHADAMDLYGRLVGVWQVDNRYFDETAGVWRTGTVVWTFGWVLAGNAVQDVMWFTSADGATATGSTVRLYDPSADHWHVVWFSPAGTITTLTGRPGEHGDIVQDGVQPDGRPIRWLFTAVTGTSFRWLGYVSADGGTTWRLEQEMRAVRPAGEV